MSVLTDKEIKRVLHRELVIHPFDEDECLSPLGYDLTIGYAANLTTDLDEVHDGKITIRPRTSALIISKEHVWLSSGLVGTLHARGSLAAKGLFLNATTVDPNWSGPMTFLVHNVSGSSVALEMGSRFVTMILHRTSVPTESAPKTNPKSVAELYGNQYGGQFTKSLMRYLIMNENENLTRHFNQLVEEARIPSIRARLWAYLRFNLDASQSMVRKNFIPTARILVWIGTLFAIILGIVVISVPAVWEWFTRLYGADPTRLIFGLTIIVAGLGVLIKDISSRK